MPSGCRGLLVKSTLEMKYVIQDLQLIQSRIPVICGGAALTRKYVEDDLRKEYSSAVFYAEDAFAGLHVMSDLTDEDASVREKRLQRRGHAARVQSARRGGASGFAAGRHYGALGHREGCGGDSRAAVLRCAHAARLRPERAVQVHQRDRAVQEPVATEDGFGHRLSAAGGGEVPADPEGVWSRR